ncbi:MAG TPA: CHAT domain-containing tetratricopeptide repeat protein, partial [Blastocatellia bacterium]|nr:CHAT domain-containing tetratricopeptide repeat protein [Blastocatellia bacterium]
SAKSEDERSELLARRKDLISPDFVRALVAEINAIRDEGRMADAMVLYRLADALSADLGDKLLSADIAGTTGVLKRIQGDYQEARIQMEKSLAIFESLENKRGIGLALNRLAGLMMILGEYREAAERFQRSLAINRETGDESGQSAVLNNLGLVYYELGDYSKTLVCLHHSLELAEKTGDAPGACSTTLNIGELYIKLRDYDRALEYLRKSLAEAQALKRPGTAWKAFNNIGEIHHLQGDDRAAISDFEKALAVTESIGAKDRMGEILNGLGRSSLQLGEFGRAREYIKRSLVLSGASGGDPSSALNDMAVLNYVEGKYPEARDYASRASKAARDSNRLDVLWQCLTTQGKTSMALHSIGEAKQAFAEAIDAVETLRSQTAGAEQEGERFFEDKLSPYYSMAGLLAEEGQVTEALQYIERAKARALLDILRSGKVDIDQSMTPEERQRERSLLEEVSSWTSRLSQARARPQSLTSVAEAEARLQRARMSFEDFELNLYAAHPDLKATRGRAAPLTIQDAAELVPDAKTALIDYAIGDGKLYAFVITRTSSASGGVNLKLYTIDIKPKDLSSRVERLSKRIAARDFAVNQDARQLYDLLLRPLQDSLSGKTSIVIAPDGILWSVPFQVLAPSDLHYLIEESAVSYTPSLTALREIVKLRKNSNGRGPARLLAIANPEIDSGSSVARQGGKTASTMPAPEMVAQVKAIEKLYGAQRCAVLIGSQAHKDVVKTEARRADVLHVAAHGFVDDASPMYSGLTLWRGDDGDDGLLQVWEIMKLKLEANTAVLAACETAGGHIGAGEGVIGLAWAFFVAGCPTTVVSQWRVESRSTTDLMVEFHRNLISRENGVRPIMTKAEALRQAELKVLRSARYRHPFYWAGFVLIGDPS